MDTYIGIDIGGSGVKYGWGNSKRGLLSFETIPLLRKDMPGLLSVINEIFTRIDIELGLSQIQAAGIGLPGMIDHQNQRIIEQNPNLPFLTGAYLRELNPQGVQMPLYFDNDANLMALGESTRFTVADSVLGITIGSGIGSGLVLDGKVYFGSKGFAMEMGHVISVYNGSPCNCGKFGCLEAYASLNGMRNRLEEEGIVAQDLALRDILLLAQKNAVARKTVNRGLEYLVSALANAIILLTPDHVVIGGGASEIDEYPLEDIVRGVQNLIPDILRTSVSIDRAIFGNKAGVIGAITLAENSQETNKEPISAMIDGTWE